MLSESKKVEIGKEILSTAIYNKGRMLMSIEKNRRDVDFKDAHERLKEARDKMAQVSSIPELMGLEGCGSRVYFSALKKLIPAELDFNGRKKHPPCYDCAGHKLEPFRRCSHYPQFHCPLAQT